jgi:hypothetical protein
LIGIKESSFVRYLSSGDKRLLSGRVFIIFGLVKAKSLMRKRKHNKKAVATLLTTAFFLIAIDSFFS